MNAFTGPVFCRPGGPRGVTWHRWHEISNASVRITAAEAAVYFGGWTFARMAFARLSAGRAA